MSEDVIRRVQAAIDAFDDHRAGPYEQAIAAIRVVLSAIQEEAADVRNYAMRVNGFERFLPEFARSIGVDLEETDKP